MQKLTAFCQLFHEIFLDFLSTDNTARQLAMKSFRNGSQLLLAAADVTYAQEYFVYFVMHDLLYCKTLVHTLTHFLLARLQTWKALIFSRVCLSVCMSVCLSVCLWPARLPFGVNWFWRNLITRTLFWSSLATTIMVQIGRRGTARRLWHDMTWYDMTCHMT